MTTHNDTDDVLDVLPCAPDCGCGVCREAGAPAPAPSPHGVLALLARLVEASGGELSLDMTVKGRRVRVSVGPVPLALPGDAPEDSAMPSIVTAPAPAVKAVRGLIPTADLKAQFAADGCVPGVPDHVNTDAFAADQRSLSRSRCPSCGKGRVVLPYGGPGVYRLCVACPRCLVAEEG